LDEKGNQRKGFIDAPGVAAARQRLREETSIPLKSINRKQKRKTALSGALKINLWERVSANEVAVFTRQLSTLLGAGMPLVPSLSILMNQEQNPLLKNRWRKSASRSMKAKPDGGHVGIPPDFSAFLPEIW